MSRVDERGLMPLEQARAHLLRDGVFKKGKGRMRGGQYVLDSDLQWEALLSLDSRAGRASKARARLLFHGMRLLAARGRDGGWGVLLERLQGSEQDGSYPAHVAQHAYGDRVPGGVALTARPLPSRRWPAKGKAFVAALRRDLAARPEDHWPAPDTVLPRLHLGDGAQVVVDCTAFLHADGTRWGTKSAPSQSPAYASVAQALVHRDPARFTPGGSNVSPVAMRRTGPRRT